ncbi:ABC transporter ATP-binding protein [Cellulophaga omnivescoria]|nr:ABC transporter ATP-binding protein [Cellulophaga omnivescoria]WBU91001.1 ABC transporter ATP-binding protein [Cellulophaga omnivescoria]
MKKEKQHIALQVTNLSVGYSSKKQQNIICKDINFALKEGELSAIVGTNGIGKSTLLRTLANVQAKLNGTIAVDNIILENYKPTELASKISVVLTEKIASKNLTVIEIIALGRQPYTNWIGTLTTTDKDKITEAISLVQIEELQHKKCYELSDGQLQKVMIARALAQDTSIILLDEPTSHLDLYHKATILKLLKNIAHKTKKTILFTTHEIEVALQLCDKILILDKNTNHFGTPTDLIAAKKFNALFPKDTIVFDENTASFKVV